VTLLEVHRDLRYQNTCVPIGYVRRCLRDTTVRLAVFTGLRLVSDGQTRSHTTITYGARVASRGKMTLVTTRWLYCVECPRYNIQLEALGYLLCTSCLLPASDEA